MSAYTGFIGLGLMGSRMAANMIGSGRSLLLYNRTRARAELLTAGKAAVADTPAEVGEHTDHVFLMLTGPAAVDAVLWGEQGLLAGHCRCRIVVNMSTVPPAYNRQLAEKLRERGIILVEALVSGSTEAAAAGSLVILAGGDEEALQQVRPALTSMGRKIMVCGELGRASSMKMVINQLLAIFTCALGEAVTLGEKCGFSAAEVVDTILAGPIDWGFFEAKAAMIREDAFPAGFPVKHMCKDLGFLRQTGDEVEARLPLVKTVARLYEEAKAQGLAELDFAAVKKIFHQ